ncbi:thioredoxin family protein [Chryseobacterium sp. ERMR1:04]|uniref:thioredoxin family protein n=1 Tax=Chryseobacterium sp. ERMR1:04 TaxID=1705393 RepID=UPI0006C87F14|nr:thioredoxin family protein [Chryseobacterium sp. ERMR1:04]KPH11732.1 redoxin [Chryseobacterium sp. ERMR1:04]
MKNLKILMTACIVGLGLLSFTTIDHDKTPSKHTASSIKGYEVGDSATDFKLKNIDGKKVSLSNFKSAKGFIVIFTCNHCPYAKKYEDRIVELDKKYKDQGYPVIAINPNDPNVQPEDGYKQMIERAKQKGFTFPYLLDEGQKVFPQYGATKTPHVFILQKENGKNIVKYIGAIDNNYEDPNDVSEHYVQDAVNALIKGEPIKMTKTVAIGCTVKVKK